jgi:putative transcriptional regulator
MKTMTTKKFRSPIAEAAHETARGIHRIGLLDARTMREFDASCLTRVEFLRGKEILSLRERGREPGGA